MAITKSVIDAIKQGKKIQAIKFYREENNVGLKEAKEAVDVYINDHPDMKEAFNANKSGSISQERIIQIFILLIVIALIVTFV